MALLTMDFFSFTFGSNITINVALPTPTSNEQLTGGVGGMKYRYENGLPVVYLLHGAYGDYSSWNRNSSIERYAQDNCIVCVMASAGLSFYQDMPHGRKYKTFFTNELYNFLPRILPITRDPKKTFVAGFSMGGYGAFYLAFSRPDLYGKAASMSGALDIAQLYRESDPENRDGMNPFPWNDSFTDPEHLEGSDFDLFELYRRNKEAGKTLPLYLAVGRDDFLYDINVKACEKFRKMDADLVYDEGEGGHNWDFWDEHIRRILDWMLKDI